MIDGIKIYLRPITDDDTELIIKWRNNPKVRQNFIYRETFTRTIHEKWLREQVKVGDAIQYIVIEKNSNKPIGSVYYSHVDELNKCAEFGIFIGEDEARGCGYGKEAMTIFVDYGFNELKFQRIYLRVLNWNIAAKEMYKKVGFIEDVNLKEIVKIENKDTEVVMMSIRKNSN